MTGLIFAVAAVIWVVAAYAFVRIAASWVRLVAMAPAGERIPAALEIGSWNFPATERRLGAAALPLIDRYRRGFHLFFACFVPFFALTILSIFVGEASNP